LDLGKGHVRVTTFGGLISGCYRYRAGICTLACLQSHVGAERVLGEGFDLNGDSKILGIFELGPSLGIETGARFVTGIDLLAQASIVQDRYRLNRDSAHAWAPLGTIWLVARVALSTED
jgi:hypothetical protein